MMWELTFFLGLQIKQGDKDIFVSQSKYDEKLVKKYEMEISKHASTLMDNSIKLDKDEQNDMVHKKLYRGVIGSLFYLTASRSDIMYSVCVCVRACARFQSSPRASHLIVIKCII